MESANNEGNVDLWVEGFDEPAWYLPPFGEAVTSRDGLREVAARGFAGWQTTISIEPRSIRVSGDWADVYSEVRGHAVSRSSNDSVAVNVKQLVVYRRTPDGWKISRLMINPNE
jgi:ketosteroid isomerase-like protein